MFFWGTSCQPASPCFCGVLSTLRDVWQWAKCIARAADGWCSQYRRCGMSINPILLGQGSDFGVNYGDTPSKQIVSGLSFRGSLQMNAWRHFRRRVVGIKWNLWLRPKRTLYFSYLVRCVVAEEQMKEHRDYRVVELDVERLLKRYPPHLDQEERSKLEQSLKRIIMRSIWDTDYYYYQGFHDIAITVHLVLEDEDRKLSMLSAFGLLFVRLCRSAIQESQTWRWNPDKEGLDGFLADIFASIKQLTGSPKAFSKRLLRKLQIHSSVRQVCNHSKGCFQFRNHSFLQAMYHQLTLLSCNIVARVKFRGYLRHAKKLWKVTHGTKSNTVSRFWRIECYSHSMQ